MLINLLLGLGTMILCLALQLVLLIAVLRYYQRRNHLLSSTKFGEILLLMAVVMFLLVLGNTGQMALWALLFKALGEFQAFDVAFYHSAVNFATLGYGDIVMSARHRLLGPLESLNGVLMVGVSTSALITVFQDAIQNTIREPRGILGGKQ